MNATDTPGYIVIHNWVRYHLGTPKKCSKCKYESRNSRQFHWSNISGKYMRDFTDWQRLCVSCHFKLDKHKEECPQGHKYTASNSYTRKNGWRECRICRKAQQFKFNNKETK